MPRTHTRIIVAHHLILTGYGHWLPNDPRGSGSSDIRSERLQVLGNIHFGRKRQQPLLQELRDFYKQATPRLAFAPLWFDEAKRQAIAEAFARTVRDFRYTVWACAVLRNHSHLVVRRHRDEGHSIWRNFGYVSQQAARQCEDIDPTHPIWSGRPYTVFLYDCEQVRSRIEYVQGNPAKEGLPPQKWPYVVPYDGWPYTNGK